MDSLVGNKSGQILEKVMSNIPFSVYQWASGHFLTRQLPDNYLDMTDFEQECFLEGHASDTYEYWDARDLWEQIDYLAADSYNFFKWLGDKANEYATQTKETN